MPIVLPGFQAEVRRVLDRVFRGEPVQEIRGQGLPGQGPSFPMSFSLLPLKGPGGEVVSALALLGEDPEPRTRVTTLAVLLGEKSSLLDAVRSARVVVWSMDPASGRITQVSSAAQEILGLGREALLADPTALRALLAPGDLERFKAARDAALDGRVGTFEALLDQGKGRPGVWTRWTLDMADGRIRGVVQDITEARDLRRRLDLAWRLAKAGGFPADPVAEVVGFVEARGGRVAFEDGKGTAFRVLLPPLPPEDE
jgi:PAS domain-containing protein